MFVSQQIVTEQNWDYHISQSSWNQRSDSGIIVNSCVLRCVASPLHPCANSDHWTAVTFSETYQRHINFDNLFRLRTHSWDTRVQRAHHCCLQQIVCKGFVKVMQNFDAPLRKRTKAGTVIRKLCFVLLFVFFLGQKEKMKWG